MTKLSQQILHSNAERNSVTESKSNFVSQIFQASLNFIICTVVNIHFLLTKWSGTVFMRTYNFKNFILFFVGAVITRQSNTQSILLLWSMRSNRKFGSII